MSEGRYNIPKQYKVDMGMPVEAFLPRIENVKCREIFEKEIECLTWSFQITDEDTTSNVYELMKKKGLSVFEVVMNSEISTELMTEVFARLIPKRFVILYLCNGEFAIGTYMPGENGMGGKMCATDYYPYDSSRMIDIIDFKQDCGKSVEQIHARLLSTIRQQKRIIMIEKAFEKMKHLSDSEPEEKDENDMAYDFSEENLDKIREDAEYVKEQLRTD